MKTNKYLEINKEHGKIFVDFEWDNSSLDNLSISLENNYLLYCEKINYTPNEKINLKIEKINDFLTLGNDIYALEISEEQKMQHFFIIRRLLGYAFEEFIINILNLKKSSKDEDIRFKIDALDDFGNGYNITLNKKNLLYKELKGDFKKAKDYLNENKLFLVYIWNNKIQKKEFKNSY